MYAQMCGVKMYQYIYFSMSVDNVSTNMNHCNCTQYQNLQKWNVSTRTGSCTPCDVIRGKNGGRYDVVMQRFQLVVLFHAVDVQIVVIVDQNVFIVI